MTSVAHRAERKFKAHSPTWCNVGLAPLIRIALTRIPKQRPYPQHSLMILQAIYGSDKTGNMLKPNLKSVSYPGGYVSDGRDRESILAPMKPEPST